MTRIGNSGLRIGFVFGLETERQALLTELRKTHTVHTFDHPIAVGNLILIDATILPLIKPTMQSYGDRRQKLTVYLNGWKELNKESTIMYLFNSFQIPTEMIPFHKKGSPLYTFGTYGGLHMALADVYAIFQDAVYIDEYSENAIADYFCHDPQRYTKNRSKSMITLSMLSAKQKRSVIQNELEPS